LLLKSNNCKGALRESAKAFSFLLVLLAYLKRVKKTNKAKVKVWKCPICGEFYWSETDAYTHFLETGHTNVEPTETERILSDKKLMKSIRDARKKGSTSSPYKPL